MFVRERERFINRCQRLWKTSWYQQMEEALGISQACLFLKLEHHLHSPFEKSIIERTIQYIKDKTENFDIIFLAD